MGDCHSIAVSHGVDVYANDAWLARLIENEQIATQYVDQNGTRARISPYNPNGSVAAIEGITSPDGRVFGKMGTANALVKTTLEISAATRTSSFLFPA